jgi:hypothetical protein
MPITDRPVGRQDTALRLVMPQHMAADLLRVGTLGGHFVGDPAFVHHDDPIREFEDFVQVPRRSAEQRCRRCAPP